MLSSSIIASDSSTDDDNDDDDDNVTIRPRTTTTVREAFRLDAKTNASDDWHLKRLHTVVANIIMRKIGLDIVRIIGVLVLVVGPSDQTKVEIQHNNIIIIVFFCVFFVGMVWKFELFHQLQLGT
jgi:hypothetical protein